jgi:hypothetical protein
VQHGIELIGQPRMEARPGRTRLRSAGASQSEAAVTVPAYVVKPTEIASAP